MTSDAAETRPDPAPDGALPAGAPAVDPAALLRMALAFYGIVALFAVGYALFSGGLPGLFGTRAPTLPGLVGGLGLGVVLVLLSRVGARAWPPMQRMSETLADLLGPIALRHALLLALLSGVAEEVLFRGALWPHLGLVGTTLLFGLVHVLPHRSLWIYPLFATLAGLLFALLREGTQSLWPCILAHVTVNGLNLAWIGSIARRRVDAGQHSANADVTAPTPAGDPASASASESASASASESASASASESASASAAASAPAPGAGTAPAPTPAPDPDAGGSIEPEPAE